MNKSRFLHPKTDFSRAYGAICDREGSYHNQLSCINAFLSIGVVRLIVIRRLADIRVFFRFLRILVRFRFRTESHDVLLIIIHIALSQYTKDEQIAFYTPVIIDRDLHNFCLHCPLFFRTKSCSICEMWTSDRQTHFRCSPTCMS